ncbi:MAG: hypothetical protein KIS77_16565 [Saprospiraceae bacterium]|nr:hypothetical protein [Saprospiraceae bacterium]
MSNPRTRPRIWRLAALSPVVFCLLLKSMAQAQPAPGAADERGIPVPGVVFEQRRDEMTGAVVITPTKNGDPLNGVTTFDLVLISRHILGLEVLDSPYKMIAADANMSNSITTFDVVEIRKLILGIYSEFPNNTAWRFVDAAYDFPNPANPFQNTPFPESRTGFDAQGGDKASFVAVKVGDVNHTAMGVDRGTGGCPTVPLAWGSPAAKPGQTVTVAVSHAGAAPLRAFQLGLRFDPALLRLLGPSQGDLPGYQADHFGLTRVSGGEIRTLWHALDPDEPERVAEPGATLFHLTFEALGPLPEGGLPLWLDERVLPCAAWLPDDTECAVTQASAPVAERAAAAAPVAGSLRVSARPNPTSGEATLALSGASGGKARVSLLDAFGNRLLLRDVALGADGQEVALPELARLPAGVYRWQVQANGETAQGHLVKQ